MTYPESPVRVVATDKGHQWHLSRNGLRTYCGRPVVEVLGRPGEQYTLRDGNATVLGASCRNCR